MITEKKLTMNIYLSLKSPKTKNQQNQAINIILT